MAKKKQPEKKLVKLKAPSSMAVKYQIMELATGSPMICCAAALGVCWSDVKAPRVRWKTGHAAEYGAQVLDFLLGRGMGIDAVSEAGSRACGLITESLPSAEEEEAALGN
jgi:hypothetical protein